MPFRPSVPTSGRGCASREHPTGAAKRARGTALRSFRRYWAMIGGAASCAEHTTISRYWQPGCDGRHIDCKCAVWHRANRQEGPRSTKFGSRRRHCVKVGKPRVSVYERITTHRRRASGLDRVADIRRHVMKGGSGSATVLCAMRGLRVLTSVGIGQRSALNSPSRYIGERLLTGDEPPFGKVATEESSDERDQFFKCCFQRLPL